MNISKALLEDTIRENLAVLLPGMIDPESFARFMAVKIEEVAS